jgi:alginate O-acetyltransferase complex protein AlgJ
MQTISENAGPVPTPRWLRARWRYVLVVIGAALFFGPGVARLCGVYPTAIENRPLVKLPSLSRGFQIFPDLTQWSIDHLPLRKFAIRADARISQDIFGEPPSYTSAGGPVGVGQGASLQGGRAGAAVAAGAANDIIPGRQGWLFLGDEFTAACHPQLSIAQVTSGLRRLDQIITASGRKLVILIPPDKDTIDGRFLPASYPDERCSSEEKARLKAALDSLRLRDFVNLVPRLRAQERRIGQPAYLPIDSHWTDRSAATVFLPAMLNPLSPRLYRSARVTPLGPTPYTGDLSVLSGAPKTEKEPGWTVTRPGITPGRSTVTDPFANFPISHYLNYAQRGVPLVRGRTLLYGDSFTERSLALIAPFFANLTRIPELSRAAAEGPEARAAALSLLTAQIRSADTVIVEQTERIIATSDSGSILDPDVLDAIQRTLAGAPRGHRVSVR